MTGPPDFADAAESDSVASDATLVAQVLDGDRAAFAQVYDRYADRLYDFANSMLRNREDAADAVADSFVVFAERLSQLREADRLRPWLYAIVRSECLRRLKGRTRFAFGGDGALVDMPDTSLAPDEAVEAGALRQLVWDAAAGLAERDRALLDLHLRQGLDGAELGIAMGVSASNAYVMMNRLRGQMERSLGALLIAKTGRDDCADLDGSLADWDGSFSPLVRKRVARHVDGCATCTRRRAAMVSPLALFAGVAAFAAPAGLRERVLSSVSLPPPASVSSPWVRRGILGGVGAAIVAALIVLGSSLTGDRSDQPTAVDATVTPSVDPSVQPTGTPTASPSTSPSASPSPSADPARLAISDTSLTVGPRGSTASTRLTNRGGETLRFELRPHDDWVSTDPDKGSLDPGESTRVTVRVDNADRPGDDAQTRVDVRWDHGTEEISIRVKLPEAPPTQESTPPHVALSPHVGGCDDGRRSVSVTVSVSSEDPVDEVRVTWSGVSSGSETLDGSGTVNAGSFSGDGSITFTATVTDKDGQSDSDSARAQFDDCSPVLR